MRRILLATLVALYGVLGAILFAAPNWASDNFAWQVSPFVAMTIGGWCLGNAWTALVLFRRRPGVAFGAALYLSAFALLQASVLVAFRDRLLLESPLSWLYVATLAVNLLLPVVLIVESLRGVAKPGGDDRPFGPFEYALVIGFIVLVGYLGISLLFGPRGRHLAGAPIFPEEISPFTARAFGAFYAALVVGEASLLVRRRLASFVNTNFALYGLVVFITAAALFFIKIFDFSAHPTQAIYIVAYLAPLAIVAFYTVRYGTGAKLQRL